MNKKENLKKRLQACLNSNGKQRYTEKQIEDMIPTLLKIEKKVLKKTNKNNE